MAETKSKPGKPAKAKSAKAKQAKADGPAKAGKSKPAVAKEKPAAKSEDANEVRLLSGGNPQIAKGDGDAPVQAYIAAMPGWKKAAGEKLDTLIERTVPHVRKAVKWNSPFYGVEGQGYFLGLHCFDKYIKLAFFRGAALKPEPPVGSKDPNTRYFHIYEDKPVDETQLADWIRQAAAIPGWLT